MKAILSLLLVTLPLHATDLINDQEISARFLTEMEKHFEAKDLIEAQTLQEQLKERKQCAALPLTTPDEAKLTSAEIFASRKSSIVALGNIYKCKKCEHWHNNLAGGVILTSDGIVLTNYHVVENAEAAAFGAVTFDGSVHPVTEVLAASKSADLALIRLAGENFQPAPVAFDEPVGAPVTAITHPDGRFYTLTTGVISRYFKERTRDPKGGPNRVAITADYAKGSSGCPIFNEHGAVIALVSTTSSIYYTTEKGIDKNLQMVVKSCVPSDSIRGLFNEKPVEP